MGPLINAYLGLYGTTRLLVANAVHVVVPVAEVIFHVAQVQGHVSLVLGVCAERSVIEGN
jgi:hypothetical protein